MFTYISHMTASNIPDGISFSELEDLARDARTEDEVRKCDGPYAGYTQEDLCKAIDKRLAQIHDDFSHPMTAKYILMETLQALMLWHTKRGQSEFEDGDTECGTAWLRDAGILQAAMQNVHNVSLPDDWMRQE